MTKVISVSLNNGKPVALMHIVNDDASVDEIQIAIDKAGLSASSWREISREEIPTDRSFRDAWVDDQGIKVAMPVAREIAHKKRRRARDVEMEPLDKQINIDIAKPEKIAVTEAKRQAIRDKYAIMQIEIDQAETPEALKAILNG